MRRIAPEQRRDELIAAAIRVIARVGVSRATTRAIAAEADMPLGAIHYIFESHDAMLHAVIETVIDEERLTAELRTAEIGSLEMAIRAGLESYIELLEANPQRELAVLELALFARRQDERGQMRTQWMSYYAAAEGLLRYAAGNTGNEWTEPVDVLARHLIVVVDGLTTTWLADQDGEGARRGAAFAAKAFAAYARPLGASNHDPATETADAH